MVYQLYEDAKKGIHEQENIRDIANIYMSHDYKPYFCIYTNKYFVHNPKKSDKRQDYNQYYREIKDKSAIEGLSTLFNSWYTTFLQDEDRKIYDSQVEDLEMIIAKYEIAVCKVISMCKSSLVGLEYKCSKDNIIEYMNIRDNMIKKVEELKTQTVEYRRMMLD